MNFVSGPRRQPTGFWPHQASRGITKSDGWATCQWWSDLVTLVQKIRCLCSKHAWSFGTCDEIDVTVCWLLVFIVFFIRFSGQIFDTTAGASSGDLRKFEKHWKMLLGVLPGKVMKKSWNPMFLCWKSHGISDMTKKRQRAGWKISVNWLWQNLRWEIL